MTPISIPLLKTLLNKHRQDTKQCGLTIETITPVPTDQRNNFLLCTDASFGLYASPNLAMGLEWLYDSMGVYEKTFKVIKALSEGKHYDCTPLEFKMIRSRLLGNLLANTCPQEKRRVNELAFFHGIHGYDNKTSFNVRTGEIKGALTPKKYAEADDLLEIYESLAAQKYLDVTVKLWDRKEGADNEIASVNNLLTIAIRNGTFFKIKENSQKLVSPMSVESIYEDVICFDGLGVPIDFIDQFGLYCREQYSKHAVEYETDFGNSIRKMTKEAIDAFSVDKE